MEHGGRGALQRRCASIRRVGETAPFRTDVRVLCATNCELRDMVDHDDFREDLYFRVNTFEIRLPAIAEESRLRRRGCV